MIESFLIKNIASFDLNGIHIDDLKQINFIYGANGSGKTTISNMIADKLNTDFKDCNIRWKYGQPLKCLVYNKQFRERNFGSGPIEGVFTLGQATKEEIEIIEEKQEELKQLKGECFKKKSTLEKQEEKKKNKENEFRADLWEQIYKKYKDTFKEAFKGFMQKELFKNKFLNEYDGNKSSLLTIDVLKEKSKTIFGEVPVSIPLLKTTPHERLSEIEKDSVWSKKIIGKADANISELIQRLNINDWVNQGRAYLQKDINICPFCQEPTITEKFRTDLETYFDESFTNSIKKLDSQKNEYFQLIQNVSNVYSQIEEAEKKNKETLLQIEMFSAYLKTLWSEFTSNKELIGNKTKEPSRSVELVSTKEQIENLETLIEKANLKITAHNKIVDNYQSERSKLIQSIWKYINEEYKIVVEKYKVRGKNKVSQNGVEKEMGK